MFVRLGLGLALGLGIVLLSFILFFNIYFISSFLYFVITNLYIAYIVIVFVKMPF